MTASPLGRYASGSSEEELHEVRLVGTPVRVFVAAREHHDDLLRELALLALAAPEDAPAHAAVPARLARLVQVLGTRYGAATARPNAEIEQALAAGMDRVDLVFQVPASVVGAADELEQLMAEADDFCAAEQLLTVRRSPAMRALSEWYLEELRRQVQGAPPRPWDGPLDP